METGPGVFVARESELERLGALLDRAVDGQLSVAFVTGEAGAGKTALVTEFARRAEADHGSLIYAIGECNAQTGEGDPYLPFREILELLSGDTAAALAEGAITEESARRLSGFLRTSARTLTDYGPALIELFVPGSEIAARLGVGLARRLGLSDRFRLGSGAPGDEDGTDVAPAAFDQDRIFEQYANVLRHLAAERPLLLVLDDLHWIDQASAGLLFHLCRRIGSAPILILGTYRSAEVELGRSDERHPLSAVLNELRREFGDVWIELDAVGDELGRELVDRLVDQEPNWLGEGFRARLFERTEGHPLFVVELLRSLAERGHLVRDEDGRFVEAADLDWALVPARVEGVIAERVGRIDDGSRRLLTVASVEGEDFTAEIVAAVEDTDGREVMKRLAGPLSKKHRLVSSRGLGRMDGRRLSLFRFRHNLFQTYLYEALDPVERAWLHEEVAAALEGLYGANAGDIAGSLARHYQAAGVPEKALAYLRVAGDQARRVSANEEAADCYRGALHALEDMPPTASIGEAERHTELRAGLLEDLGRVRALTGAYDEARELYGEALALHAAEARLHRARLLRATGDSWQDQHAGDRALALYDQADELLGPQPADEEAAWWNEWIELMLARAWAVYFARQPHDLADVIDRMVEPVRLRGTPTQRAMMLQRFALLRYRLERYGMSDETMVLAVEGMEACRSSGDVSELPHAQFNVGFCHLWRRELDQAVPVLEMALDGAVRNGSAFQRLLSLTYLTIAHRFRGDEPQVAEYVGRAAAAAADNGIPTYIAAAAANRAWLALREGRRDEARSEAVGAVDTWSCGPARYPFHWLALAPMLVLDFEAGNLDEARRHAGRMLEPDQQLLPDAVREPLERVAEADGAGLETAIDESIGAFRELGYV